MKNNRSLNTSDLKRNNTLDIIKVIRKYGPITKPDIARLADLTSVTIHNFINELMYSNLVVEDGIAKSNGGRRAVLYKINPIYGYIIGQNIGIDYIRTNIFDINLEPLYLKKVYNELKYSESVVNLMTSEIKEGLRYLNLKTKDCLGIGISVPGQVDHKNNVVKNLTNVSGWNGIPIKSIFESKLGITTYIENDNIAYALALKWLGIVSDSTDVVCVTIRDGVGSGVLVGGELFYGNHSNAGEIGHITIQYDGPKCNCGSRGCIEALTSDLSIIKRYREIKGIDQSTSITIEYIIAMAKAGNEIVNKILKEVCCFISIAIDCIIKAYDPEAIVVLSKWLREFPDLVNFILDDVYSRSIWVKREDLKIIVNDVDRLENIGASTLVLENIFMQSENNTFLQRINT